MNTMGYSFHHSRIKYIMMVASVWFFFCMLTIGCGGGGGGGSSTSVQEGQFIGGTVEGLDYVATSSKGQIIRGVTDETGTFKFYEDDAVDSMIQFKVGDYKLGLEVKAKKQMQPADLASTTGSVKVDDNQSLNITRFILSLDVDGDSDNGILIPDKINLKSSTQIDFAQDSSEFADSLKVLLITINDDKIYKEGYEPELPSTDAAYNYLLQNLYPNAILLDHLSTDISYPSLVSVFFTVKDIYNKAYTFNTAEGDNLIDQFYLQETLGSQTKDVIPGDPEYLPVIEKRGEFPYVLKCVLMIDRSSSVQNYLEEIKAAAKEVLISINDDTVDYQQEWTILQFSDPDEIEEVIPFTSLDSDGKVVLDNAIDGLSNDTHPSTDLYGGIQYGLSKWSTSYKKEQIEQGLLVVITDGQDTARTVTADTLIDAVGDEKVFMVIVGDDSMENLEKTYKITSDSIALLKEQTETDIPSETLDKLRLIKNTEYETETVFKTAVENALGTSLTEKFYDQILDISTFKGEKLKQIANNGGFYSTAEISSNNSTDSNSLSNIFTTIRSDIDDLMDSLYRIQYYSPLRGEDSNAIFNIGLNGDATNDYNYADDTVLKSVSEMNVFFSAADFTTASADQIYINVSQQNSDGIGYFDLSTALDNYAEISKSFSEIDLLASTFYQSSISEYDWEIVDENGQPATNSGVTLNVDDYFSYKASISMSNLEEAGSVAMKVTDTVANQNAQQQGNQDANYTAYIALRPKAPESMSSDEYTVDFDSTFNFWDSELFELSSDTDDNAVVHEDPGNSETLIFKTPENYLISPKMLLHANDKVSFTYEGNTARLLMSTDKVNWVAIWGISMSKSKGTAAILASSIQSQFDNAGKILFEEDEDQVDVYCKFSASDNLTVSNNDLSLSDFRIGPIYYSVSTTAKSDITGTPGGTVTADPVSDTTTFSRYPAGTRIVLTAQPAQGFSLLNMLVTNGSGAEYEVDGNQLTIYGISRDYLITVNFTSN